MSIDYLIPRASGGYLLVVPKEGLKPNSTVSYPSCDPTVERLQTLPNAWPALQGFVRPVSRSTWRPVFSGSLTHLRQLRKPVADVGIREQVLRV
jgi:hypothetical protein